MIMKRLINILYGICIGLLAVTGYRMQAGGGEAEHTVTTEAEEADDLLRVMPDTLALQYEKYFVERMEESATPGAAVTVIRNGRTVLMKGYGVRKEGSSDSVNINTVFRIGSVSKGFASVLTGILVHDSVLGWDDRIIKHVSDFKLKDTLYTDRLTVKHVLSHTTGLPMHAYTNMLDHNVPYGDIVEQLDKVDMIAPPGEVYAYQNVVYSLISDVLRSTSGRDYTSLMNERIFQPLNMHTASLSYNELKNNYNKAMPHVRTSCGYREVKVQDKYYSVLPSAGVNASINDMNKWLKALLGGNTDIVPADVLNGIATPVIATPIKRRYRRNWKELGDIWYSLGWRIMEYKDKNVIYHGGFVRGYRAEMAFIPSENTGIVVLFNSSASLANECVPEFLDMLID